MDSVAGPAALWAVAAAAASSSTCRAVHHGRTLAHCSDDCKDLLWDTQGGFSISVTKETSYEQVDTRGGRVLRPYGG